MNLIDFRSIKFEHSFIDGKNSSVDIEDSGDFYELKSWVKNWGIKGPGFFNQFFNYVKNTPGTYKNLKYRFHPTIEPYTRYQMSKSDFKAVLLKYKNNIPMDDINLGKYQTFFEFNIMEMESIDNNVENLIDLIVNKSYDQIFNK